MKEDLILDCPDLDTATQEIKVPTSITIYRYVHNNPSKFLIIHVDPHMTYFQ